MYKATFSKKCILFFSSFLFVTLDHAEAAVEGGALVKGSAFSDDTTVVPAASGTSKAIKWSQLDYDTTVFDFNSSTPTRLKVKSAGDYFLSFTGPVAEASRAANARSQVFF